MLFQDFDQLGQKEGKGVFALCRVEVVVSYRCFIGGYSFLYGGFGQWMDSQFFPFCYPGDFEYQPGSTVSRHDFVFPCEFLDYGEQVQIVNFSGMLFKDGNGIATGEYQCVIVVGMAFELGYGVVCVQQDAGISPDGSGIGYCKYFIRNTVFKKCFQVLE